MKDKKLFKRKTYCDRLLRVWDKMPEMTFVELICRCNDLKMLDKMTDEEIIRNCKKHVSTYKAENSIKNKILKGIRSCVTKTILW